MFVRDFKGGVGVIGGNTTIKIQTKTTTRNEIGGTDIAWADKQSLFGWIDLSGGDSKHSTYNAKIQESTHVFIGDYVALNDINSENSRVIDEDGKVYDVMLIDDPMNLHKQIEIYLKYTGGQ